VPRFSSGRRRLQGRRLDLAAANAKVEERTSFSFDDLDQVWLSAALAPKQTGAFIDRRTKVGGDGSDHDPSWVTLDL
jgi:exonuclease III